MPLQATAGAATYDAFGGGVTAANYIEDVFSTFLYTGNGSTQTITNGIDLSTKGGLVWIKSRSNDTGLSVVHDTTRGAANRLSTNLTDAQVNLPAGTGLTAFNSDGFSVGTGTAYNSSGPPNYTYASWTFRKQPKFFDVVTYTGNGSALTVNHNLGSVPGCIIVKNVSGAYSWAVYHRSNGNDKVQYLDGTQAASTSATSWNSYTPTSTNFQVGGSAITNSNGDTYVAYLFAHDAGGFGASGTDNVISCGSTDGVSTVNLGYEPQWVLVKASSSTGDWYLIDNMRGWTVPGGAQQWLFANSSSSEGTYNNYGGLNSTGFSLNISAGVTYIYIAIRRGPMRTPTTGTSVFTPVTQTLATGSFVTTGFVTDMGLSKALSTADPLLESRLTKAYLRTNTTGAESSGLSTWDYMNGYGPTPWSGSGLSSVAYGFRRAPGFFDVVCYTGTGSATTVTHNLGVVPELLIVKSRDSVANWIIYSSTLGSTKNLYFSSSGQQTASAAIWNSTDPTASVFSVGTSSGVNGSGNTYVAYLFATVAGVSKVGSYTGTGTTLQVNCGFTAGARFVLIKRTDSTGDWYVWDSARGIVAGNDPYLLLNSTAAEVTNTDYVDTYSAGFEISSTAPAAINDNGGTFIFLAIA